jgi:hypothetical protein
MDDISNKTESAFYIKESGIVITTQEKNYSLVYNTEEEEWQAIIPFSEIVEDFNNRDIPTSDASIIISKDNYSNANLLLDVFSPFTGVVNVGQITYDEPLYINNEDGSPTYTDEKNRNIFPLTSGDNVLCDECFIASFRSIIFLNRPEAIHSNEDVFNKESRIIFSLKVKNDPTIKENLTSVSKASLKLKSISLSFNLNFTTNRSVKLKNNVS